MLSNTVADKGNLKFCGRNVSHPEGAAEWGLPSDGVRLLLLLLGLSVLEE